MHKSSTKATNMFESEDDREKEEYNWFQLKRARDRKRALTRTFPLNVKEMLFVNVRAQPKERTKEMYKYKSRQVNNTIKRIIDLVLCVEMRYMKSSDTFHIDGSIFLFFLFFFSIALKFGFFYIRRSSENYYLHSMEKWAHIGVVKPMYEMQMQTNHSRRGISMCAPD